MEKRKTNAILIFNDRLATLGNFSSCGNVASLFFILLLADKTQIVAKSMARTLI